MKRKLLALFLVVAMLGVSLFAGLTTVGAENGAKASTKVNIFDDMENYKDGEVVASYDYNKDPVPAIDTAWRVASTVAGEAVSLTASTAHAYSGKTSMMASTANGRYFGFKMNAVEQKEYTVSFYAYIEGEEGETPLTVNEAYVYPTFLYNGKSQIDFFKQNADGTGKPVLSGSLNGVLAWLVKPVDAANKW